MVRLINGDESLRQKANLNKDETESFENMSILVDKFGLLQPKQVVDF